jgi:hypothetical protein
MTEQTVTPEHGAPEPPAGVIPPAREPAAPDLGETPTEAFDRQLHEANEKLQRLADETTQREWLLITRALDRSRQQIGGDIGLTMLAMLWVREKREHGGASWDKLLDLTDRQLEDALGFPAGERPEA